MTGSFFNPLHELLPRQIESVTVPQGSTVYGGYVLMADDLKADFNSGGAYNDANRQVYAGTLVATLEDDVPAILMNGGYEELTDGRKPAGQPLYTEYAFTSASSVPPLAVRPEVNDKYEMSINVLVTGTPVAGDFIIPTEGSAKWTLVHGPDTGVAALCLKVEKVETIGVGGIGAMDTFTAMIVRVVRAAKPDVLEQA